MPTVHWEAELYRVRYHLSCLERFDAHRKLCMLEKFMQLQILFLGALRRRDGNNFRVRRRRFMV